VRVRPPRPRLPLRVDSEATARRSRPLWTNRPHNPLEPGLAGDDGEPAPGVEPMSGYVTFEATTGGTRMTAVTRITDSAQSADGRGRD
jgi:hypothetical protein